MEEFNFYIDEKKTIWYRGFFTVEADTYEEAEMFAKKFITDDTTPDNADWEQLTDSVDTFERDEFISSKELYDDDGTLILNNIS